MSVLITEDDFDVALQHERLKSAKAGAIVTFTGTVRDLGDDGKVSAMMLEHYPGMTEVEIETIVEEAKKRWPLSGVTVIHRVGLLQPCDNIVFVGCASAHRQVAFQAVDFIMDFLKANAPFWKKEDCVSGSKWVKARISDYDSLDRWND